MLRTTTAAPGISSDVQLAELLTCAGRRLRRASMAELSPLGITWAQARVLRMVADGAQPPRMADIAAAMGIGARSITSMVDGLEQAGLVARRHDRGDRRAVRVEATGGGRRLLAGMDHARREAAAVLFGTLPPRDRAELARLLAGLAEGSEHDCARRSRT